MSPTVALGLPGMVLQPGDHVCAFHRGAAQRDEILMPYLREGLHRGDKVVCVVDTADPSDLLNAFDAELDLDSALSYGQLTVLHSSETYLKHGSFSAEGMLSFWEKGMQQAIRDEGFNFVRAVGEMTWALRDLLGVDQLVFYESEFNRVMHDYPQVVLCLYDLERFTNGRVLMDVMRTHPKVYLGSSLLDNPWYLQPDEFLEAMAYRPAGEQHRAGTRRRPRPSGERLDGC